MMKRFLLVLMTALAVSCGPSVQQDTDRPFPMVRIPSIVGQDEAGIWLAGHYWDAFSDTSEIHRSDSLLCNGVRKQEVEQAYVNYLSILDGVPFSAGEKAVQALYDRVHTMELRDTSSNVFETLSLLARKYLYDVNSPFRNEDLYAPFLKGLSEYEGYTEEERMPYRYDWEMTCLNRTGTEATDFQFSDKDGRSFTLHGIEAEWTLIFFSNPGCQACKTIMDELDRNPVLKGLVDSGRLAVLNIYIDEQVEDWYRYMPIYPEKWYNGYDPNLAIRTQLLYNVRAIPSLYLLDRDKTVILKDAPQEKVFFLLSQLT